MGRLLIGLDEIVKGGDEAQSKVLDLAFNGKVAAFIKVAEPYSLIKGYVGERITIEEQYHLFEPVRQFGVKAFRLDRETIREIIRFGEGDCQFFKSGIGFDDQDDLIEYRTITRNYILGINEKFYGSSTSPVDLKKIKEGGVYVDDGSESDTGCDFEYIYRDALDQREFSGFVIGQNLYDSVLKGVNVYSLKMIKAMLSCSMICSAGFLARFDPRFDLCRLPWSLLHGKVLYIAYHSLVVNKSWPPQKELIYWRGHEVLPDPEGGGVFLRPRARNEYVLCSFDGQIQEIENEAKNCVVPRPVNISIKTSDLQFLVADRHLILKAVSGELDVGCRDAGESGEDGIEEVVNNLDEVKGSL